MRWMSFMLGGFILLTVLVVVADFVVPSPWATPLPVFDGNRPAGSLLLSPETAVGAAIPIIVASAFILVAKMGLLR